MRNSIKRTAAVVLAAVQIAAVLPFQALAQEMDLSNSGSKTTYMGKTLYTGQVHSHTSLSDGENCRRMRMSMSGKTRRWIFSA